MMTYKETIDYLYQRLPMFSRIGAVAYKKDLRNTLALCEAIGNPQQKLQCIHIAGTNGKGSVSHILAAVFQQAGYKTGLYTSPHLKDFRERIKVNGIMMREDFVVDFTSRIIPEIDRLEPSFFEITVAMAFDYFEKEAVEIAIIETGLGGRLDSTNIITPLLSIITNIGFDHVNILGDTLELIAGEKAGIIKPGIPVVIGEKKDETEMVFRSKAESCNAPLVFAGDCYRMMDVKYSMFNLKCHVKNEASGSVTEYLLDLNGIYQQKNLLTVLAAVDLLKTKGWTIEEDVLHHAIGKVKQLTGLHGRWEVIRHQPAIVLDVAHNEDGMKQVMTQIELIKESFTQLHIVMGMVRDKDIQKVLALLPANAKYYFTRAQIPRALPEAALAAQAAANGLNGLYYPEVNTALNAALAAANKNDLILVCGSVFVVGEVADIGFTA
jgi:dihydrofolate synthase / folylpolyglutamate synthase